MAPHGSAHRVKKPKAKWSMTVMMNARDLSRDDDFLSHLLVEHLGTDDSPLQVHKMDPSRRLPKHDPSEVLAIVKRHVVRRGGSSTSAHRVKRAVDALLELPAVKQYLHKRSTAQINAFATHASRYFELYLPTGSIEISHTSRYSHRTGKSELCILATTPLKVGQVISDLKGSLAHLTVEEDEELKRTDSRRRDGGIRRDFSVIHSNQKNKSHLFLGPARFVNHDCDHNVELFRDGRIITFRVIKPIAAGQEVTAHYGEGYFGKGNRHCLCQTCERLGRGGYKPEEADSEHEIGDDSSTDEETREERIKAGLGLNAKGNPNERRTRRGVYAILPEEDTDDEDRVGAAEKVAAEVPQQPIQVGGQSRKYDGEAVRPAPAEVASPSSSTSLSTSSAATPPLSSEEVYVKQHERKTSSSSSALSSLPDSDKPLPPNTGLSQSVSNSLDLSSSVPGARPTSSADSPIRNSGKPAIVRTPTTPAPSRMSTRSLTASQLKDKLKEEISDLNAPVRQANPVPSIDKRSLRGSRSTTSLTGTTKQQRKQPENSGQESKARLTRQTRHSMPSPSAVAIAPRKNVSNAKVPSTGAVSKTTPGKLPNSTKPSTDGSHGISPRAVLESKVRPNAPCCSICSAAMPHLIGTKVSKKTVNQCARCKRHQAIFGALWPNRNASTEILSSSSSESSSAETVFEAVREKPKDFPRLGHKLKYSRKYVEVKHPAVDRPVKRRKTEPAVFSTKIKSILHPPRNSQNKLDEKPVAVKGGGYPPKTFSIPGGRSYRALGREKLRNLGLTTTSLGLKRRWVDSVEDSEQRALDKVRSKRRGREEGGRLSSTKLNPFLFIAGSQRTIRRFRSLTSLPAAKPLAALCARPTPNSFARHSWAVSEDGNTGPETELLVDTSSELTEPPDPEPKEASPSVGDKRKREPLPSNSKPKGKRFYMKDEKKPMPKGWVLVTDSSEETGEEEVEEADPAQDQVPKGEPSQRVTSGSSQVGVATGNDSILIDGDARIFYQEAETDSPPASTPSLTHTPFSRATSTPTQSSGTLVDEHVGAPPSAGKRVVSKYSLRGSTTSLTPSTIQSSKRRKVSSDGSYSQSKSQGGTDKSTETDARACRDVEADDSEDKVHVATLQASASPELDVCTEDIEHLLEDIKTDPGHITMIHASFPSTSEPATKGEQVSAPIGVSSGSPAIFLGSYGTLVSGIDVPDSESKRMALEVSNIIHGTAFINGLPDARTTWKPKYHFSELGGWDSDHSDS